MFHYTSHHILLNILSSNHPQALSWIAGDREHASLNGMVKVYAIPYDGVLIETELFNLPDAPSVNTDVSHASFFQLRFISIPTDSRDFKSAPLSETDPAAQPVPEAILPMPMLLANQGYVWMTFYDTRFSLSQLMKCQIEIRPADEQTPPIATGTLRPLEYP